MVTELGVEGERGGGLTHQRLAVLFRGATDTGGDVMVLTLTNCLWPSGSLACGRMLAIQFKFRHTSGVSTTGGASLAQNTRESRREGGKEGRMCHFLREKTDHWS